MLYLTSYNSSHLRKNKPHGEYRKHYETFDEPDKASHIWYLENSAAIEMAKSAFMEPMILARYEVTNLEMGLQFIADKSPIVFKYMSDDFNDEEANQVAQFIRQTESLEHFEFIYCHTGGGTPYRFGGYSVVQPKNKLTKAGFELITQAIEFNPTILNCITFYTFLDWAPDASSKRERLLERNRKMSTECEFKKALAYKALYHELLGSHSQEMLHNSAISKLIRIPTLQALAFEAAFSFENEPSQGLSSLSSDLLSAIELSLVETDVSPEKSCEIDELSFQKEQRSPAILYSRESQPESSSSSEIDPHDPGEAQSSNYHDRTSCKISI